MYFFAAFGVAEIEGFQVSTLFISHHIFLRRFDFSCVIDRGFRVILHDACLHFF